MKNVYKLFFLFFTLIIFNNCSDDDSDINNSSIVEYDGTNLIVRDEVYQRQDGIEKVGDNVVRGSLEYASGEVNIVFDNENIDLIVALLDIYDLSIVHETSNDQTTVYTLSVPELFEEQWAEVLQKENGISDAEVNGVVHIN